MTGGLGRRTTKNVLQPKKSWGLFIHDFHSIFRFFAPSCPQYLYFFLSANLVHFLSCGRHKWKPPYTTSYKKREEERRRRRDKINNSSRTKKRRHRHKTAIKSQERERGRREGRPFCARLHTAVKLPLSAPSLSSARSSWRLAAATR